MTPFTLMRQRWWPNEATLTEAEKPRHNCQENFLVKFFSSNIFLAHGADAWQQRRIKNVPLSLPLEGDKTPESCEFRRSGGAERVCRVGGAGMGRTNTDLADHSEARGRNSGQEFFSRS